jgi:hypothetical protein
MRDLERRSGWNYYSYQELVDSFEVKEVFSEHDNDYQGDSFYLLKNGTKHGILIFGWGSCSGCDTLEAIGSDFKEVTAFRNDLWNSIQWFDTKADVRKYIKSKDFDLEWYRHHDGGLRFIEKLKAF